MTGFVCSNRIYPVQRSPGWKHRMTIGVGGKPHKCGYDKQESSSQGVIEWIWTV